MSYFTPYFVCSELKSVCSDIVKLNREMGFYSNVGDVDEGKYFGVIAKEALCVVEEMNR